MKTDTFPKFRSYVCPGDSIEWNAEGFDFAARLEYDSDTKPTDFDCYDEETIKKWRDDEWFYAGLIVSVSKNGVSLSDHAASLWGIDCNYGEENDYLSEMCQDLQDEAIKAARVELARIRHALEVTA
jgi:hypothetical protein